MNSLQCSSSRKLRFEYIALAVVVVWIIAHVVAYIPCINNLGKSALEQIFVTLRYFFLWQFGIFLIGSLIIAIFRPAAVGVICIISLVVSSVVLLLKSNDALFIGKFILFSFWFICSVQSTRIVTSKVVGTIFSTWGLSAAFLFAIFIPVAFFAGLLGVVAPFTVAFLAVASATPGLVHFVRNKKSIWQVCKLRIKRLDFVECFLIEIIWAILTITFVQASGIESLSDAARVYLPYIHQVAQDQGISHQYACFYRLQPMAGQLCYALGVVIGSDVVGKWLSWLTLVSLSILVAEETCIRSKSLRAGLFAGALLLGCPFLSLLATTLYIDIFITLLCSAGFIALFRALRPACLKGLLFAAIIMSSAVQTKYTGLVFAVIWGVSLFVGLLLQCNWRIAFRWSFISGLILLLAGSPWFIYVYLGTGNPFYPFLNNWFESPYWIKGLTLQQMFEVSFKLPSDILGKVLFPWSATYHTSRFVEGWDGYGGFGLVALLPCLLVTKFRRSFLYWDLFFVGIAMVVGILFYTPYVRYWLPAYPLLIMACAVALFTSFPSFQTLWKGIPNDIGVCLAAGALVIIPSIFNCSKLHWQEYAKLIDLDTRIDERFGGSQAIKQINTILDPNDGILCSGFEGVYLLKGRPYEYNFWWNGVYHISDAESFADFCRKHNIHYWMVSSQAFGVGYDEISRKLMSHYWTDDRLVSGVGAFALYDIRDDRKSIKSQPPIVALPSVLETKVKQWTPQEACEDWVNLSYDRDIKEDNNAICLGGSGLLLHRLHPSSKKGICRVECNFYSEHDCSAILRCDWFGKDGKKLSSTMASKSAKSDFCIQLYVPPPPEGADSCWLHLWKWQGRSFQLKNSTVTWLDGRQQAVVANRNLTNKQ